MAVLVLLVQDEGAGAEVIGQDRQLAQEPVQLALAEDADALQAFGMGAAGGDVVEEELAVQDHVVAGQEALDLRIHGHAGLLPQQLSHCPALR